MAEPPSPPATTLASGSPGHLSTDSRSFLLLIGALTAFSPLSTDMYLAAFPVMATDLHTSLDGIQGTLAAFFTGMAIGQLIHGPLSDRFGRRRPLLVGCAIYTVSSALCALAPNVHTLLAVRLLQAIGGSAGIVIVRAVVRDLYAVEDSARVFSRLMLVMGAAPILAPLIGSGVLAVQGWRAIFWLLTAFGLAAFSSTYSMLPETHGGTPGAARPAQVLRNFWLTLSDRSFLAPTSAAALSYLALFSYLIGSPAVLIAHHHLSPTAYAVSFGAISCCFIGSAQVNARLVRRIGPCQLLFRGSTALLAVSAVELAVATTDIGGAALLIAIWMLQMCAMGFVAGNAAALALAGQGPRAGSAAALLGSLQFAAGGLAGTLLGVLTPLSGGTAPSVAVIVVVGAGAAWLAAPWKNPAAVAA